MKFLLSCNNVNLSLTCLVFNLSCSARLLNFFLSCCQVYETSQITSHLNVFFKISHFHVTVSDRTILVHLALINK